jgi:hypothetical protein
MLVKQTEQERGAALQKLHQSLKPAVLLDGDNEKSTPEALAKVEANANLIKGYMQKNFTDARGVTDFSFDNLRAAVTALTDDLAWSVPPTNYGARARAAQCDAKNRLGLGSHKTEFDRPELNKPQQPSVYEMQREKEEKARVNIAVAETEKLISGHQGRTHARTNVERGLLSAERDRLIVATKGPLTSERAKAIRKAIEKKVREMSPSALGS